MHTTLRIISMFLMFAAFAAVCWWAFSPKRRGQFSDAAQLPFAEEEKTQSPSSEGKGE